MAKELNIDDLVKPGRNGVTNKQMIPAINEAISDQKEENAIAKLRLLRQSYLYVFDKSVRYLKKPQHEFVQKHIYESTS